MACKPYDNIIFHSVVQPLLTYRLAHDGHAIIPLMQWGKKQTGFTIVELLIVVVVIAILAAITIVSYNGIQNRAKESAAQSTAAQVGKRMLQHAIEKGEIYPADKAAFLSYAGVADTSDTTYDYFVSPDQKSFCAGTTKQNVSYSFSASSGGAVKGRCMENLAANPSAAGVSLAHFGAAGSTHATTSKAISSDRAHSGTTALKATVSAAGQLSVMSKPAAPLRLNAGESLSWSFWVYSTKAGNVSNLAEANRVSDGTYTNSGGVVSNVPANTWTKISRTWSPPEDQNISQIGFYNLQVVSGDLLWFDEFAIYKSDKPYQYSDGDSTGAFWNGNVNASSSVNIVLAE